MIDQRRILIVWNNSAMTVSGFDGRAVKDEDGQEQSEPARERRIPVLKFPDQHARQLSNVLESGSLEIVLDEGSALKRNPVIIKDCSEKVSQIALPQRREFVRCDLCGLFGTVFLRFGASLKDAKMDELGP